MYFGTLTQFFVVAELHLNSAIFSHVAVLIQKAYRSTTCTPRVDVNQGIIFHP